MYVCVCNAITDSQIRKAAESGARDIADLQQQLGVAAGCGSCMDTAASILRESRHRSVPRGPVSYVPSPA